MIKMRSVDELISEHARANTNYSWESMMTYELAQEILEDDLSIAEWVEMRNALDDGVFEIVMSFKK